MILCYTGPMLVCSPASSTTQADSATVKSAYFQKAKSRLAAKCHRYLVHTFKKNPVAECESESAGRATERRPSTRPIVIAIAIASERERPIERERERKRERLANDHSICQYVYPPNHTEHVLANGYRPNVTNSSAHIPNSIILANQHLMISVCW